MCTSHSAVRHVHSHSSHRFVHNTRATSRLLAPSTGSEVTCIAALSKSEGNAVALSAVDTSELSLIKVLLLLLAVVTL